MPASLPGSTAAQNLANPSAGRPVLFDLLSGPLGSPLDRDQPGRATTGGLSTGIGFGPQVIINGGVPSIKAAGFNDDYIPGVSTPYVTNGNSTMMYAGGGRSVMVAGFPPAGVAGTQPYTAGFGIGAAGNSAPRDGGAGPTVFTGFATKVVTAAADVAAGAAIETGFSNRSGVALTTTQSTFGVSTTATAAPTP